MKFLRKIFGPSIREVWHEVSQEIGGHFEKGNLFASPKITLTYRSWTITLDTYSYQVNRYRYATYTRMRAPFVSHKKLSCTISPHAFRTIHEWLYGPYIKTGARDFDQLYAVVGRPREAIKALLSHPTLRLKLHRMKLGSFSIKDDEGWLSFYPHDVDLLYFQIDNAIKDKDYLKNLFELFCLMLDELHAHGYILENPPHINIR